MRKLFFFKLGERTTLLDGWTVNVRDITVQMSSTRDRPRWAFEYGRFRKGRWKYDLSILPYEPWWASDAAWWNQSVLRSRLRQSPKDIFLRGLFGHLLRIPCQNQRQQKECGPERVRYHGKERREAYRDFLVFSNCIGIVIFVSRRHKDLDIIGLDVLRDLMKAIKRPNPTFKTYSFLEIGHLFGSQCISLGNDRNQINSSRKTFHEFNIESLERMTRRGDKVETSVDTAVNDTLAMNLIFLFEIEIKSRIDILQNWFPRVFIVDGIAESGCVDDRELEVDTIFFQVFFTR